MTEWRLVKQELCVSGAACGHRAKNTTKNKNKKQQPKNHAHKNHSDAPQSCPHGHCPPYASGAALRVCVSTSTFAVWRDCGFVRGAV